MSNRNTGPMGVGGGGGGVGVAERGVGIYERRKLKITTGTNPFYTLVM